MPKTVESIFNCKMIKMYPIIDDDDNDNKTNEKHASKTIFYAIQNIMKM